MCAKKYSDIKKIIWIVRSLQTCDFPHKDLIINRNFRKIDFYGKVFSFINHIFGLNIIKYDALWEKGFLCGLDGIHSESIIEKLIALGFAQKSPDGKQLETLFPDDKYKIYETLYMKKEFGTLSMIEELFLEILDSLSTKPISLEEIFNLFNEIDEEYFKHAIKTLFDVGILDKIIINNKEYYLTPLKTYGHHKKYVEYCNKHSSDEIDLVGELLEFCNSNKGIPYGLLPNHLKDPAKLCLEVGIFHGVNYEFGDSVGDLNFTLIFPTSEMLDMIKSSINDFDKIHASLGILVYGVYYNPLQIQKPQKYIEALIDKEELRGTSIHIEEKMKQFNPSIFAGIIDISQGFSSYFTKYGYYKSYEGMIPKLIPSEENREALRFGLKLFEENDPLNIKNKSSKNNIFEQAFYYADTAGVLTYKPQKKSLQQQKVEEYFEIMKGS